MTEHAVNEDCVEYRKLTDELFKWYKGNGVKGAGKLLQEHDNFIQQLYGMSKIGILLQILVAATVLWAKFSK